MLTIVYSRPLWAYMLTFQPFCCNRPVCGSRLSGHKIFARVSNCAWIMNKGGIRRINKMWSNLTISHVLCITWIRKFVPSAKNYMGYFWIFRNEYGCCLFSITEDFKSPSTKNIDLSKIQSKCLNHINFQTQRFL